MGKSKMIGWTDAVSHRTSIKIAKEPRLFCLHLSRTGAAPRGECKTSAPSIGIPCHHERESLEIKCRWAFYKALTTRQDKAPLNSFPWKTSFANEYGWNNRHAANATYLEINVRATNQHQVDRQTDISGTEKM